MGDEGLGRRHANLRPGVQVDDAVAFQGHRAAADVGDGDDLGLPLPRLANSGQRVGGLARLRDADHQRVLVDDRLAVAELRRRLDFDRDARQVLDDVFAEKRSVVGGAGRHHLDVVHLEQLAIGQSELPKVTSPSSLNRPRSALETASGASLISFAMKCGKPPFWAWLISHLTSITFGLTATPPMVLTSCPSREIDTISPLPSSRTFFV